MGRRRAVLIVEYTRTDENPAPVPAERWERVFGGSGVMKLHVEVQEDRATP